MSNKKQLDNGFEVEWCSHIPDDGYGGADFDRATFVREDFVTIEEARARAVEAYKDDVSGQVVITQFEMVPYEPGFPAKYAEYIGESEYYTGDEPEKKICKYGDKLCPCPDGDPCHYEGPDAWPAPTQPPESV